MSPNESKITVHNCHYPGNMVEWMCSVLVRPPVGAWFCQILGLPPALFWNRSETWSEHHVLPPEQIIILLTQNVPHCPTPPPLPSQVDWNNVYNITKVKHTLWMVNRPFNLFDLFSHFRPCDGTPQNCSFQISSYARASMSISMHNLWKDKSQIPWRT